MSSLSNLSPSEFSGGLTAEIIRPQMIIQLALTIGPLAFLAVVFFVVSSTEAAEPSTESMQTVETLSIVHALFFLAAAATGQMLYRRMLTREKLQAYAEREFRDARGSILTLSPTERVVALIRTAMIIRTACFEGAAFFGLATLMMAAQSGLLQTASWLWLNVTSTVALVSLTALSFLTKEQHEKIFAEMIQPG